MNRAWYTELRDDVGISDDTNTNFSLPPFFIVTI